MSRKPGRLGSILGALAAIGLFLAPLAGCGTGSTEDNQALGETLLSNLELATGERLQVVATTNIVADVVRQVAGSRIELTTLMGIGVDPHSFVPAPADIAAVHDAHLLFFNGAGLEEFLDEMVTSAGGRAIRVQLADGLKLLQARPTAGAEDVQGDEGADPHVWFDVQNIVRWVGTISDTLSTVDRAGAGDYRSRAEAYLAELRALDSWIVGELGQIPESNRTLITNHPALGYLAARYGLVQVGAVYPVSPSSEPSARDIAALIDAIRRYDVPAVFTESTVNARLADQVAQETGIELVALFTGSLGPPGSGADTYIGMMQYDVRAIVGALH